jgi:hypothetical protein
MLTRKGTAQSNNQIGCFVKKGAKLYDAWLGSKIKWNAAVDAALTEVTVK